MDNMVTFPFNDVYGVPINNSEEWIAAFAAGIIPQDKLGHDSSCAVGMEKITLQGVQ